MRRALGIALLLLAGCATEKLALQPPSGVDFSGHWKLNEADSDDPQRVAQSQGVASAAGAAGGQGGRGGGRRGGGSGPAGQSGPLGPAMPGVGALSDGLRWPGRELDVQQTAGIVTVSSMGVRQIYKPAADSGRHAPSASDSSQARGRDRRDGPPPACGWDGRVLVIQAENPDDDHPPFEERYSLSEDGQRLIEVIAFKGGRSGGFTVSRVWDRVTSNATPNQPASQ
jgi:hypothetical protein